MAQLALYVEEELMGRLDRAARQAGVSRSKFVGQLLNAQLDERLPASFFEVLGAWVDTRAPEKIMRDIRRAPADRRLRLR